MTTATPETEKPRQPSDMDMNPKNVVKPEGIANPSSQLIVSDNDNRVRDIILITI